MNIESWLQSFRLDSALQLHTAHVLRQLPDNVRSDIMGDLQKDGGVTFYDYDPGPGVIMQVPVKLPSTRGTASRSIVLKRTLRYRSPNFVHWLIAHELAHAHLRNAGRWPGDDPEVAADSLANEWGFPRPSRW